MFSFFVFVFLGVTLFCLFSTVSTAFEHQHSIEYRMMDNLGQPCNQTAAKAYAIQHQQQHYKQQQQQQQQYKNQQQQLEHEQEMPLKVMENIVDVHDDGLEGSGDYNQQDFILSHNMQAIHGLNARKLDETIRGQKINRSGDLSHKNQFRGEITFIYILREIKI